MLLIKDKLAIKGTWDDTPVPDGVATLLLAPGIKVAPNVSGNPIVPTTRAILDDLVSQPIPDTVLDIGSGNAILGLAAKALGARVVHCYDINPWCNETAKRNVAANKVPRSVRLHSKDIQTVTLPRCGLVMCTIDDTDILADILVRCRACLEPGGLVIALAQANMTRGLQIEAGTAGLDATTSRDIPGGYRALTFGGRP